VTILVCGSRKWRDAIAVHLALACEPRMCRRGDEDILVLHGNAGGHDPLTGATMGADKIADREARGLGYEVHSFPADWKRYGKAAGPIRNRLMLDEDPDLVLAFGGGRGTLDTITEAERRGIPVRRFGKLEAA